MVIPVFYGVDPSHVRKQIGGFGDVFKKTCEDKPEDQKQRWVKALTDISNLAGEDLRNGYVLFIPLFLWVFIIIAKLENVRGFKINIKYEIILKFT